MMRDCKTSFGRRSGRYYRDNSSTKMDTSVAIGTNANATGNSPNTAVGWNATATGIGHSAAYGTNSKALGEGSLAVGPGRRPMERPESRLVIPR